MSFWTVFKLFAALCVLAVMIFTGMLAYHVVVRPLGGVFAEIIPNPAEVAGKQPDADFAKMLDSAELPDIESYSLQRTFNAERDLEPHLTLTLRTRQAVEREALAGRIVAAIQDKLPPPGYIDVLFAEP